MATLNKTRWLRKVGMLEKVGEYNKNKSRMKNVVSQDHPHPLCIEDRVRDLPTTETLLSAYGDALHARQ